MTTAFAGYPSAFVYPRPNAKSKEWIDHLLWGDWIRLEGEEEGDWVKVHARGLRPTDGGYWMRKSDIQDNHLLEIYFVDIGQGDGCFIVTPDNKFLLIDAGEEDNMSRFLKWKFNTKNAALPPLNFQHSIITHSDSDHYKGFAKLFSNPRFEFENIFHNGLVERTGDDLLGATERIDGVTYHTEIVADEQALLEVIDDAAKRGRKLYPNLLKTATARGSRIRMLCSEDKFLPGYEDDKDLTVRVLAPVPETDGNGRRLLRRFESNDGKTKNGHSIVLRFEYGAVKILLGGDLNIPAEHHLLKHYTGIDPMTDDRGEREELVEKAREFFASDVAKACHHGSADFSTLFIRAINSAATVISSGDDESHAHPRPDSLGAFGKYGRGSRPLIFSTELARSARELIKNPSLIRADIDKLAEIQQAAISPEVKEKLEKLKKDLKAKIERTVTVYGLINLRTDGEKVVIAQKLEARSERGEWDLHRLEPKDGVLEFVSKHE